ncbi:MAG: Bax inhibitor-1/YccA family protein [Acidimicrobiia bacterium]|nr:Bax inhibitor-1/YccA family protein [Acidimicrobiia bacterium]MDH5290264.1 Bax inhibitor-1/YccA family protein [Acidimicrobiia bacterium]
MSDAMTAPRDLRSGNPALSDNFVQTQLAPAATARSMSVAGVSAKTLILLGFVVAGGVWGWASATQQIPPELGAGFADTTVTIPGGFWLASIGAFFLGIFIAVEPRRAGALGIVYALAQGFCLGAISAAFDAQTDGIVGAAVLSTVCVFLVALLLYVTGIVRPTQKLAFAVIAGIGGLMLIYFFVFVVSIFNWGWLYSESFRTVGLIITIISVILAALSLVLDFGTVAAGVEAGASKELEWYLAFSLMVTLIWLYITLLKLLALLARQR